MKNSEEKSAPGNYGVIIGSLVPIAIYLAFNLPFFGTLFNLLEQRFYDFKMNIGAIGTQADRSKSIAVIKIDDESFNAMDMKWPWNRRVYAKIIDELSRAGAKTIAFDIFFSESSKLTEDPLQDASFAAAINASTVPVILAYSKSDPLIDILKNTRAQSGFIENIFDSDSVVRRSRLLYPIARDKTAAGKNSFEASWNFMALKNFLGFTDSDINFKNEKFLLNFTKYNKSGGVTTLEERSANIRLTGGSDFLINYATGPSCVRPISFHKIITGQYDPEWIKGKIALIGATVRSLHDDFSTPLMLKEKTTTPGVFIHAYAQATFMENAFIREVKFYFNFALSFFMCLFLGVTIFARSPLNAFLISITISLTHLFSSTFMFYLNYYMHSITPQIALFLTYVLMTSYKYIREEREKQLIKGIFKQYVTPEVVDELLRDPEKLSLGGQKRTVTILFADIRNFTRLSEQIEPETVVELLNEYFDSMLEIVYRHGGILDKYLGDGMMVIFGAPVPDPDSTIKAVRCALEMQKASIEFSRNRRIKNLPAIDGIGIGINTGDVVVGNIGSQKHKEYTIIGDNVNLTARIVSIALVHQVLISENTFNLLSDRLEVKKQETVKLKGKSNPVNIFEIINVIHEKDLTKNAV